MKIRTSLLKAFAAASTIGLVALTGCGGSSRAPVAADESAISADLDETSAAVRGASAVGGAANFQLVATPVGTCSYSAVTATRNGTRFSLALNRTCDWVMAYRRTNTGSAGQARVIRLRFGGYGVLMLSRITKNDASRTMSFGNTTPGTVGANGEASSTPANDPTTSSAFTWGTGGTSFAAFVTANPSIIAAAVNAAETVFSTIAAQSGVTTCSAAAGLASSLTPSAATPGSTVTVTGAGFSGNYVASLVSGGNAITGFNASTVTTKDDGCADVSKTGVTATTASETSLTFTVPSTATAGQSGTLYLYQSGKKPVNTGLTVTIATATTPSDTTAPTISSLSPTAGGSHAHTLTTASVTFSEAMTATTAPDVTVTLLNPSTGTQTTVLNGVASNGTGGLGTVAWSNNNTTLTFTLTDTRQLTAGTSYVLTLTFGTGTNGLKDAAGNALSLANAASLGSGITVNGQAVSYTFSTPADTTAPTISSVSPTAGGAHSANIITGSVTFSEAMTATTAPDVTVTLLNPSTGTQTTVLNGSNSTGTGGLGSVAWTNNNTTLTFTLSDTRRLTAGTSYQLTLTFGTGTNGLKDAAGNALSLAGVSSLGSTVSQVGQTITYTFTTN